MKQRTQTLNSTTARSGSGLLCLFDGAQEEQYKQEGMAMQQEKEKLELRTNPGCCPQFPPPRPVAAGVVLVVEPRSVVAEQELDRQEATHVQFVIVSVGQELEALCRSPSPVMQRNTGRKEGKETTLRMQERDCHQIKQSNVHDCQQQHWQT